LYHILHIYELYSDQIYNNTLLIPFLFFCPFLGCPIIDLIPKLEHTITTSQNYPKHLNKE